MRKLILLAGILFFSYTSHSQNYIGIHKTEIKKRMRIEFSDFSFEREISNGDKSFLKYSKGRIMPETLIFVLKSDGTCRYFKHIYEDVSKKKEIERSLTKKYSRKADSIWLDDNGQTVFEIELEDKLWYLSVNTRLKE